MSKTTAKAAEKHPIVEKDAVKVPSVEDRFIAVQKSLGLFLMMARACGTGDDLGLFDDESHDAWHRLADVAQEARGDVAAVYQCLPAETLSRPAPTVERGSGGGAQ